MARNVARDRNLRKVIVSILKQMKIEDDELDKTSQYSFKKIAELFKGDRNWKKLFKAFGGDIDTPRDWARIISLMSTVLFDTNGLARRPAKYTLPSLRQFRNDFGKVRAVSSQHISNDQVLRKMTKILDDYEDVPLWRMRREFARSNKEASRRKKV